MLSVFLQGKYNFSHQNTLLDAFRMNSRNIIGSNLSMVIPLLANPDLRPMLVYNRHVGYVRIKFYRILPLALSVLESMF